MGGEPPGIGQLTLRQACKPRPAEVGHVNVAFADMRGPVGDLTGVVGAKVRLTCVIDATTARLSHGSK